MDRKEIALTFLKEDCTCALVGDKTILCSDQRGVAPLLSWLDAGKNCEGMFAADKVVTNQHNDWQYYANYKACWALHKHCNVTCTCNACFVDGNQIIF